MANTFLSTTSKESAYRSGDSFLHRAAPRTKILLALVLLVMAGMGGGLSLVCIALVCHLGLWISGAGFSMAWKRLGSFKGFLFVLGGLPLFLTPGTPLQPLAEVVLPITREGLECGVLAVSRLALMVWISMILVYTTRPEALMDALTVSSGSSGGPRSSAWGQPFLQETLLVAVLAFQALPCLFAEAETRLAAGFSRKEGKENDFGTSRVDAAGFSKKEETETNRIDRVCTAVKALMAWTVSVLSDPERFTAGSLKGRQ